MGPAVVLGQDQGWKDGELQARNRVWLLHGNRVVVVTPTHLRAATDTQKILHQVECEDWPSLQHLFNQSGKRYQDLTLTRGPTPQEIEAHADDLASGENKRPRLPLFPDGDHDHDVPMNSPGMTWFSSIRPSSSSKATILLNGESL